MGIKNWFGKSLMNLLRETKAEQDVVDKERNSAMERMFGSANPAIVAFRIENGYVVRTMDEHTAIVGGRVGGFTYCKDHAAIAEHIVGSEAKRKLGIRDEEYQQEMFAAEKARAVAMQGGQFAQVKRATNRI